MFLNIFAEFSECTATILAIRTTGGFVDKVDGVGSVIGLVLDRTVLYAEAGGQSEDHGFIVSVENEVGNTPLSVMI